MIEQWLYSIVGGMIVVVIAEAVFAWFRKIKRKKGIVHLRKFFSDTEIRIKKIRGSDDGRVHEGAARLAYFKSRLENAKLFTTYSEHLRADQKFELVHILNGQFNIIAIFPEKQYPELKFYEQFFDELKKLRWLNF